MPNRESKTTTKLVQLLAPVVVTDDVRSLTFDVQGFDEVLITVANDAVTAAAPIATNNFAITLLHKETAPTVLAGYVAVPAEDRIGSFANLNNTNAAAGVQSVAYVGYFRFLHVFVDETGTASAGLCITAIGRKYNQEPANAAVVATTAAPS